MPRRSTRLLFALLGLMACAQPPAPPPAPAVAPPKPALEFLGEWGTRGEAPGQLQQPVAIAADAVGNVYIADAGNKFIQKFDPKGRPLLSFQDPLLHSPSSLAVDSSGAIYVADAARNWVFVFRSNGERYRILRGSPRGRFRSTPIVAVDLLDNLYVLESGEGCIFKFRPYLHFDSELVMRDGEKVAPAHSMTAMRDGRILVSYAILGVWAFTTEDGSGLDSSVWGQVTKDEGRVLQLTTHGDNLIGTQQGDNAIHVRRGGKEILSESMEKYTTTKGDPPLALTATSRGDLFVVDPAGARVLRFRMNF